MDKDFKKIDLEFNGNNSWNYYRIPGIIVTSKGTILAYYETRLSTNDWSARNIGMRSSIDDGESWEGQKLLINNAFENTINNPVMISCRNGEIHFLWQENYRKIFHQISNDDGKTWSEAKEITELLKDFRKHYKWTVIALGPGHGIELSNGRLLVSVWMSNGDGHSHKPSVAATIYSDNNGDSWHCGQIIGSSNELVDPNESSLAELSDGRVMINIRHNSDIRRRVVSISTDGVSGWMNPWFDMELRDPICFASLAKIPVDGNLLFVNCDTDGYIVGSKTNRSRENLTIKMSLDSGFTWTYSLFVEKYAGYADLAISSDGQWIYCFYERSLEQNYFLKSSCLTVAKIPMSLINN